MIGRGPEGMFGMGRMYFNADKGAGGGDKEEKKKKAPVKLEAGAREEHRFFTRQIFTADNNRIAAVIYAKPETFGMGKGGKAGEVSGEMLMLQQTAIDEGVTDIFLNLYNMGLVDVKTNSVKDDFDQLVAITHTEGVKVYILGYGEAGAPPWAKALLPMLLKVIRALARTRGATLEELSGVYSDAALQTEMAKILAE